MKSIRLIFFLLVIGVASLIIVLSLQPSLDRKQTIPVQPSFFVGAFGKGKLYRDVTRKELYNYNRDAFSEEKATIFTDHETSAEFLFSGHRLIVMGNSGIEINPKLNQCVLIEGTLLWKKVLDKKSDILIGSSDMSLRLSDSGILNSVNLQTTISNYF
ncbi:MAG TPA: hypothetical protein P5198_10505, partial [Flexilinea sp.]|nr:hypothetical protein [Flexilinea sp.]